MNLDGAWYPQLYEREGRRGGALYAARRFELFLEAYRRPDGDRWGGADLKRATGGGMTRSYVANLRKGRIVNPGHEKMRAIVKAIGFPPGPGSRRYPPAEREPFPRLAETSPEGSSDSSEKYPFHALR